VENPQKHILIIGSKKHKIDDADQGMDFFFPAESINSCILRSNSGENPCCPPRPLSLARNDRPKSGHAQKERPRSKIAETPAVPAFHPVERRGSGAGFDCEPDCES
jgi:hypothetical protein